MTREARLMSGILLLLMPSIQYGGYFLLNVLKGSYPDLALTDFQRAMFRAGHAHAGVLVILGVLTQLLIDQASLPMGFSWILRIGFPLAALLISGGFFFSAIGKDLISPNGLISVLYVGAVVLAFCLIALGVGLVRR